MLFPHAERGPQDVLRPAVMMQSFFDHLRGTNDVAPETATPADADDDLPAWPGQWRATEIEVSFTGYAFQDIGWVAGCDDELLRERLRYAEYAPIREVRAGRRGAGREDVLMCDPKTNAFFRVRVAKTWGEGGVPVLHVLDIWPEVGRASRELRSEAARKAMPRVQFEFWQRSGEPITRELPRFARWYARWNSTPQSLVTIDAVMPKKDRIAVELFDIQGQSFLVGHLPLEMRTIPRAAIGKSEAFWSWVDQRLRDSVAHNIPGAADWDLERIEAIRIRSTRGLPRDNGTRADPLVNCIVWERA